MMEGRYRITEGSESGHCCFGYSVIDTERPNEQGGIAGDCRLMCECMEHEDAERIRNALNAMDMAGVQWG